MLLLFSRPSLFRVFAMTVSTLLVEEQMLDFPSLWQKAISYHDFLETSGSHRGLWEGLYRLARIPEWARLAGEEKRRNLLVLVEDWCGDASNTVPVLARWADETDAAELRILRRDENPEVMDRYLTNGARSIPIVIVLDENLTEVGHWGPRPNELQQWVMENRAMIPKAELYPQVRKWYARDRGETTLRDILSIGRVPLRDPSLRSG
jgi:hypothetical protein